MYGAFAYNSITELAILGTPTFHEYYISSPTHRTFSRKNYPYGPLQLKRYCFNHSALSIKDQLDISNAVHDCTFWCETGDMEISTNYNCTEQWSTACDAGFYFAPKPAGMQVSMSDTCTPCPSGKFQSISGSTAPGCTSWRTCLAGQIRLDGTNTTDATCQTCTSGYQPNNNSIATSCMPWTTSCSSGQYLVPGTVTKNGVCEACPVGRFQPNSNSTATGCTSWTDTSCLPGEYLIPGTNITDGVCLSCTSGYQPTNNSDATSCLDWTVTECQQGEYLVPGTVTKNGVCEPCTSGYQSTNNSDATECTPWTDTSCPQAEYLVPGTSTTDGECEACSEGRFQSIPGSDATECTLWTDTSCLPGEYLVPGTNTTDGVCEACTSGYQPNNNSVAITCLNWTVTTCPSGQYRIPGTTTTDGACEPCPAGTYQPVNDSNATICDDINDGKQLADDYGWVDVVVHSIRTVTGWSTDKADVKAAWRSKGYCATDGSDGQVYDKSSDVHCDVNRICFSDGTLDCPIGSVIIDAMRCSDKKEHLLSAWNTNTGCPSQ